MGRLLRFALWVTSGTPSLAVRQRGDLLCLADPGPVLYPQVLRPERHRAVRHAASALPVVVARAATSHAGTNLHVNWTAVEFERGRGRCSLCHTAMVIAVRAGWEGLWGDVTPSVTQSWEVIPHAPQTPPPCSIPGCPELTRAGDRCPKHSREANADRTSRGGAVYTTRWQRIRRTYLYSNPWCVLCGQPANVADPFPLSRRELIARGEPNPDAAKHLRRLCSTCHNRETARHQPGGFADDVRMKAADAWAKTVPALVLSAGPTDPQRETAIE